MNKNLCFLRTMTRHLFSTLFLVFLIILPDTSAAQMVAEPLLRYGERTPQPRNYHEAALQLGYINATMTSLNSNSVNKVYKGTINFGGHIVDVVIKPDETLEPGRLRDYIPVFRDNRSADAAYHLNRFLDLVDTPEHVIRDDAPIKLTDQKRGGAGIQILATDSRDPTHLDIEHVRNSAYLSDELEGIAVFDVIIGNKDRHNLNWRFRPNPLPGQRTIVAIDHSLSFSISTPTGWGNHNMINWYLASIQNGLLSPSTIEKLKSLLAQRPAVDAVLALNLEDAAIKQMWLRVKRLLDEGKVFEP